MIEDWTEEVVGITRAAMQIDHGMTLPTVELKTQFTNIGRLGDRLDFELQATRIGISSIDLALDVTCAGETRFAAYYTQVLVVMKTMRPTPWPAEWRSRILEKM